MVGAYGAALRQLWTDRCTVIVRQPVTDSATHLTSYREQTLIEDEPCRLSHKGSTVVSVSNVPTISQEIKLIIQPDLVIPAGSKIAVTRNGVKTAYTHSSQPARYDYHQEIALELFKKWA